MDMETILDFEMLVVVLNDNPPMVAMISMFPFPRAVIFPRASMVARDGLFTDHFTEVVIS